MSHTRKWEAKPEPSTKRSWYEGFDFPLKRASNLFPWLPCRVVYFLPKLIFACIPFRIYQYRRMTFLMWRQYITSLTQGKIFEIRESSRDWIWSYITSFYFNQGANLHKSNTCHLNSVFAGFILSQIIGYIDSSRVFLNVPL